MRARLFVLLACALSLGPGCDGVAECVDRFYETAAHESPVYSTYDQDEWDEWTRVPIDAHPWFYTQFAPVEDVDIHAPWQCALQSSDDLIPITVEPGLLLTSERPPLNGSTPEGGSPAFVLEIVRLVPSRDLAPPTTYSIECSDSPYGVISDDLELTTRADTKPSLAPPQLEIVDAYIRRGDDDGCDSLRNIRVEFDDFDPAFFAEGGLIEAKHSAGQTFPITEVFDGARGLHLLNEGDYTLTAVAADGERSEPRVLDVSTLRDEGVYLPDCSVTNEPAPRTLWILAPLLLLVRRRRAA